MPPSRETALSTRVALLTSLILRFFVGVGGGSSMVVGGVLAGVERSERRGDLQ